MSARYSLPTIHPPVELLKNAARLLHFMAAAFIALNAVHQLSSHEGSRIICYTQLVIAADILILVFFGAGILHALPRVGVAFRLIEALTFFGIWLTLDAENHPWLGYLHMLLGDIYLFICYREWKISRVGGLQLKADGICFPKVFVNADIKWLHIKKVVAGYNSVIIETVRDKKIQFSLRQNLKIEELEQINEFCSLHSQLSS